MPRFRALTRAVFAFVLFGIPAALSADRIAAQVPQPNGPTGTRRVHPMIASPVPGLTLVASPHFAVPDGIWNHGEGFPPSGPAADHGGWHGNDDGTNVTSANVHVRQLGPLWTTHAFNDPFHPLTGTTMLRLEGWLRPAGLPLPTVHPLYGELGTTYVDQGAFELFRPLTGPGPTQKILICIQCQSTAGFPADRTNNRQLGWYQAYRGLFSPDGLVRDEPLNQPRTPATFLANDDDGHAVERPGLSIVAALPPGSSYWPIAGYPVLSVMHRQTTLNEQRYLQLVQAIKCLLQENSERNPLGIGNALTPQQIAQRVVVVFTGGSNGGLQAQVAALRHPHLVHGAYAVAINPSLQRFYGEHDFGHALSRLSGAGFIGAGITPSDFLHWNQYPWSQGLEMHDMSFLRHFVAGTSYRPACFLIGDEDITSTGTDWVKLIDGAQWRDNGVVNSTSSFGWPAAHRFGWMVAENACHQGAVVPVTNPYTGAGNQYEVYDIAHHTFVDAVNHRSAELENPLPIPPLVHVPRSQAQQRKGLDDPQEWFLGRAGQPPDAATGTPSGMLLRDDAFGNAVAAQTAGAQPGRREAMLIRDGHVYVGSAEGIVSKFFVDTAVARQPLVRAARSERLGHEAYALAALDAGGSWSLVVGSRRHLYKLNPANLSIQAGPVELPWEVAQPHHMKVADVLPAHTGKEIVFASVHGGLVFYDASLNPIHEWPEPGIADFGVDGSTVTILSHRGMLAKVTFGNNHVATLHAASASYPPMSADGPCQGWPHDLELMRVDWTGFGVGLNTAAISLWTGDVDGTSVRGHWLGTLAGQPYVPNLPFGGVDIATCLQGATILSDAIGDHALVLGTSGELSLYNQFAVLVGTKVLSQTTQGYYPFGAGAHTLVVGELVPSTGTYEEEIVVATSTGLMWLHVNDLLSPGSALPAPAPIEGVHQPGFWMEVASTGGVNTHVQPRTNQTLAAAWAIARRPVAGDNNLHVLDQRGAYWRVSAGGQVSLWDRSPAAQGARGWGYVGPVSASPQFQLNFENLILASLGTTTGMATRPWCPKQTLDVAYENSPTSGYIVDNWSRRNMPKIVFEGFLVHDAGGHVLSTATGCEAWCWSHAPGGTGIGAWGNLVEGLRVNGGVIDGLWASTGQPQTVMGAFPNETGNKVPYHALRSFVSFLPVMSQQAVRAVKLTQAPFANQTAVVLGRPGGRVGVLLPGSMRTSDTGPDHQLGPNPADESADVGYGVSALAMRHETGPSERLRIWCGTVSHPAKRPAAYGDPAASLADDEVAVGAVHQLVWTPGSPGTFATVGLPRTFHPTLANPRGAYGVVGLLLAELLPTSAGDELVVATLSGDLIVLNAATMAELWRTHLPGAIGLYNSMLAEDLDGVNGNELYVAGSWGLWRFTRAEP